MTLLKLKFLNLGFCLYIHFYLKDKIAEENFLKSYEIAKSAIKIDPKMTMHMLKQHIH